MDRNVFFNALGRYRLLADRVDESRWRELPNMVERLAAEAIARDGVLKSPDRMGAFVCREPL